MPVAINIANGRHLFFNKQIYPFQVNELGGIIQGSAVSLIIGNKLKDLSKTQYLKIVAKNNKVHKKIALCVFYRVLSYCL